MLIQPPGLQRNREKLCLYKRHCLESLLSLTFYFSPVLEAVRSTQEKTKAPSALGPSETLGVPSSSPSSEWEDKG